MSSTSSPRNMADNIETGSGVGNSNTTVIAAGGGPGGEYVPLSGIIGLTAYLALAIVFCLYGLIVFWPTPIPGGPSAGQKKGPAEQIDSTTSPPSTAAASPSATAPATAETTPATTPAPSPGKAKAFGFVFEVWDEVRLLWIVILAGALGSLIHALRSVYWYVGNRNLVRSWLAKYLVMPFAGSALSVMFYFVIRGGFFSPQSDFSQTSPFGFAALSAMVGLFSEQAVLKLKQVAETVLSKPEQGADPTTPQNEPSAGANKDSTGS
ncbi:MAG TPA: hypothetical protein VEX43_07040 [Chthoniobacterales bacterium]|nr:hypothetical protein [Chthoniobacterales bacterium]